MSTKPTKISAAKAEENPFTIVTGTELTGSRVSNPLSVKLAEQMMKLTPGNKFQSVFVSPVIAKEHKDAQNLILAARRIAKEKSDKYVFAAKFSKDRSGKFMGANVWRVN